MTDCPNCHAAMTPRTLDAHPGASATVTIDSCAACSLFWFDQMESIRLSPRAVLELFQFIGATRHVGQPLQAQQACPRCRHLLAFTHDVQRTTRFTYWRCTEGHGRLITFHQFLAEKNFLRPPSVAELARLRDSVRQVTCSQCGAPVDLRNDSACAHCGTPVTLIDPQSVEKALQELSEGGPATAAQAASNERARDAQIDALFELARQRDHATAEPTDLVTLGVEAVAALIGNWLSTR